MFKRFRDRRLDEETRARYRETLIMKEDLIWPVFIVEGASKTIAIPSMPGVYRYSLDTLLPKLEEYISLGLTSILLFGVPEQKGIEQAYAGDGLVQTAVRAIKQSFPSLEVITDVCLCSYTEDGHCHIGDNDSTCELLARIAVSHAQAGVDIVAPSDMMDGRVHYIKKALLDENFNKTKILSYSAKYASSFYGPFREAADCVPKNGDRKTYQMDICNVQEAMEEISADIEEGADQIMVKPALAYLDIIYRAKQSFKAPIVAYNVSGEYAMLNSAVQNGVLAPDVIWESMIAIKRAGADRIVSYHVPYLLEKL
ncbi:MAG: porphobilinogen synthase, partial [Candidatus Margulisiibacteriota bacterium]